MDPAWNKQPPKGTLPCILCKCVISFPNKDKQKYFRHMKKDHGAFFNINLILIINLLERKQILKLIANIKSGEADVKKNASDVGVQTNFSTSPSQYQPTRDDDILVVNPESTFPRPMMLPGTTSDINLNAKIDEINKILGQFNRGEAQTDASIVENEAPIDCSPKYTSTAVVDDQTRMDFEVPDDVELEETISITPRSKKFKREAREHNSEDPIEVMMEGQEEFNILDMTNEDFVLTPGGPQPIQDYTSFVPGAIIPASYDPSESFDTSMQLSDVTEESAMPIVKRELLEKNTRRRNMKYSGRDLIEYLKNCSEYFKTYPKQVTLASSDQRISMFSETDPCLPSGWKCRRRERIVGANKGRFDMEFLSPELTVFRSRIAVVEYMRAMGGYSDKEITNVLPVKIKKERM